MQPREIVDQFNAAQNSLVIQQSDFSLAAIFQMVRDESIDIRPHYQRRDRWSAEKQSALLESFLLNVPVPPVYLSEDEYGRYSVIDGKQRITAVCEFLDGRLRLKTLSRFPQLNGYSFHDLPQQLRNALTVRPYFRVTTLLKQSNESLKYEVFLRLNTGGETLRPQEIRNVAYSGPLNDLLFKLSEDPFLRTVLKITSEKSAAFKTMDDLEHVLRFFTLQEGWKTMGSILGKEMDSFMAKNRFASSPQFSHLFDKAIRGSEAIWGRHAFHKPTAGGWREQLISPLYDAQMVAISLFSGPQILKLTAKKDRIIRETRHVFETDSEFVKSVSQSTNNASAIRKRIGTIADLLQSML